MYSRVRDQFSTSALILSIVALVFAVTGGAMAANSGGSDNATASKAKAKKGPPGPRGPKGAPGAKGDPGAPGTAGTNGTNGKDGTNGTNGTNGKDGKTPVVTPIDLGEPECGGNGGAEVGVEGQTGVEICNGAAGAKGNTGDPWTAGGILPTGATETGGWAFYGLESGKEAIIPISFAVPLQDDSVLEEKVHYPTEANFAVHCHPAELPKPKPDSGHLCVYSSEPLFNAEYLGITALARGAGFESGSAAGALIRVKSTGANGEGAGYWAVTG